ncbi:MAG: argininosuccinate lyase [Pyrinomonadaceae bacterium]
MNRIIKIALMALLTAGIFYLPGVTTAEVSAQAAQDFTVVNKTGIEIYALYVTPHNAKDWGDDILGADTLEVNDDLDIVFDRKEKATMWDLRVEDSEGNFIEWENFNLRKISKITLFYKNRKPTAVVE